MKQIVYLFFIFLLTSCAKKEAEYSYSWEEDLHQRLLTDFDQTENNIKNYIKKYIPNVTDSQMRQWEITGALECRIINGQKRYFTNAAPNLFRIDSACAHIKQEKDGINDDFTVEQKNMQAIIASVIKTDSTIVQPKRMRITYTLTVNKDAVPAGKIIRCWLPYPRQDIVRQQDVKLISTSEKQYILSPAEYAHSTLYMGKKAKAGEPTVFRESFEYTSFAEWHNLNASMTQPYDTTTILYKVFTSERDKHIVFTPQLRQLAARLTVGISNPYEKALAIFRWINQFPWASAREYSTIENIPEYVLENKHGDCGQVTLLFLTLCRICGIPAHFQSGFMMHPGSWNLHDWGEIYFEGIGWVPVDQSFGIEPFAKTQQEKDFFVGGIDSWRMVVNNDFGMPLYPEKKYPRSETVDFQRGEVEWDGGNLYFPQWDYQMDIEYLN